MADDYAGNASTVAQLPVGGQGNGDIETAADADWFGVSLLAGTTYLLQLRGFKTGGGTLGRGDAVPYLTLRDGTGALLRSDAGGGLSDDPVIVFTPATTARYLLDVQELQDSGIGTYTVAVSEAASTLRVNLPVANESSAALVFTLTLSKALATPATVSVATSTGGLADPRQDFVAKSETVTFAPGQTVALFTVVLNNDTVFEPTETVALSLSSPVGLVYEQDSAFGLVLDNDAPFALPSDPLLPLQWALYPGAGANVLPLWPDLDGTGVRVGVFDQGIDATHPDLDDPLLMALGRNTVTGQPGGGPLLAADSHGTVVAGVIAAERNAYLGVGVAYGADLVSLYSPLTGSDTQMAAQIAGALQSAALPLAQGGVHVLNMGWGFWPEGGRTQAWPFADNFRNGPIVTVGQSLQAAAERGRDGLGTVVVQPAGNSAGLTDNTNLHNLQNSRYVITVGSTAYDGNATGTSAPGASVLVAAPGGGGGDNNSTIVTTDRVGSAGYSSEDWVPVAGTTLAAPVVCGTVALMLQANPALGWRDVQQILAYTARQSGDEQNTWQFNRAGNWNGGGLHFDDLSHDLGFGLVDARAAVRLAESWRGPALTSSNQLELRSSLAQPASIPDANGVLVQSVNVAAAIDIERVELTVKLTHAQPGELSLLLTAPGGSSSWLLSTAGQTLAAGSIDFTFSSVLHWGESGQGDWQLAVFDLNSGNTGQLLSWSLNLVGKPDTPHDTYIYTDEFARATSGASERALLSDSGGLTPSMRQRSAVPASST